MKHTILLIEDNAITSEFVRISLESSGYSVLEAPTGRAGIRMAVEHSPDLILQDLLLPDIDGFELAGRLRALPEAKSTPIIAFSAFHSKLEEAKMCTAFTGYLSKPIEPTELIQAVANYLAKQL